jgi:transposase
MLAVSKPSDREEPQGMLAREEDVEAHALRAQGWSISAIARHLGRDRKTIRAHLSGEPTPGARRRPEDRFARFEPYAANA